MRKERRYDHDEACPVEAAFDVLGGKWKGVILFHLLGRTIRFNEFRRLLPGVTQRMLTLQLRELEQDGLVHREIFREVPPKVEYSLTDFGRSLEPVILPMREWGARFGATISERRRASTLNSKKSHSRQLAAESVRL